MAITVPFFWDTTSIHPGRPFGPHRRPSGWPSAWWPSGAPKPSPPGEIQGWMEKFHGKNFKKWCLSSPITVKKCGEYIWKYLEIWIYLEIWMVIPCYSPFHSRYPPWFLVVSNPFWKIWVNGKDDIPYMKWKIKHVWNHQPALLN